MAKSVNLSSTPQNSPLNEYLNHPLSHSPEARLGSAVESRYAPRRKHLTANPQNRRLRRLKLLHQRPSQRWLLKLLLFPQKLPQPPKRGHKGHFHFLRRMTVKKIRSLSPQPQRLKYHQMSRLNPNLTRFSRRPRRLQHKPASCTPLAIS